jgi:cardiolipin synthase
MNDTAWQFYISTPEAWEAMLAACRGATRSIDLEQFIFSADAVGQAFVDVLCERARAGVRVRLIADAGGSFSLFRSPAIEQLTAAGVSVVPFNTLLPGSIHNHTVWFFRDHQKLLVIDGQLGFTGGICLAAEMRLWRDTHVRLAGPVVAEMKYLFEVMWRRAHKRRGGRVPKLSPLPSAFAYIGNAPLPRSRQLYHRLIAALRQAKSSIYLTTPYFVPDDRMRRVLELAAYRGVAVHLLVPAHSDHRLVDLAARSYFANLLRRGVSIYQYQGSMIHSKTIIIDDEWSTIGSFNFDYVSAYYNFEANIVSTDRQFASDLKQQFLNDVAQSTKLDGGIWENRSWVERVLEYLVQPLRNFL